MNQETHTMQMIEEHEGTETWECPICGRRVLIEWTPWKKTTLVEGDMYAVHRGGKGGLQVGNVEISQ